MFREGDIEVTAYVAYNANYETASESVMISISDADTTEVNNLKTGKLNVIIVNGKLVVEGISSGDSVVVYDLRGIIIYHAKATGSKHIVELPCRGVYIVAVDGQKVKVVY